MGARDTAACIGILAVLSASCVTGPNYKRPTVPEPSVFRGASSDPAATPTVSSFGDQKWWEVFQDDALHGLIETAIKQNYDVRIAAARILEARALVGVARADQLPEVTAAASAINERLPTAAGRPAVDTSVMQLSAS